MKYLPKSIASALGHEFTERKQLVDGLVNMAAHQQRVVDNAIEASAPRSEIRAAELDAARATFELNRERLALFVLVLERAADAFAAHVFETRQRLAAAFEPLLTDVARTRAEQLRLIRAWPTQPWGQSARIDFARLTYTCLARAGQQLLSLEQEPMADLVNRVGGLDFVAA